MDVHERGERPSAEVGPEKVGPREPDEGDDDARDRHAGEEAVIQLAGLCRRPRGDRPVHQVEPCAHTTSRLSFEDV